jgi:hypothetical protein
VDRDLKRPKSPPDKEKCKKFHVCSLSWSLDVSHEGQTRECSVFLFLKLLILILIQLKILGVKTQGVMDGVLVWIRNEYGMIRIINTGGLIVNFQCITNFGQQPA